MVASSPSTITRSQMIIKSGKGKSLVSTTFNATFANGSQKMLNLKEWVASGLITDALLMETALGRNECVLYFLDWSNNPLRGDFKKHYPKR